MPQRRQILGSEAHHQARDPKGESEDSSGPGEEKSGKLSTKFHATLRRLPAERPLFGMAPGAKLSPGTERFKPSQ